MVSPLLDLDWGFRSACSQAPVESRGRTSLLLLVAQAEMDTTVLTETHSHPFAAPFCSTEVRPIQSCSVMFEGAPVRLFIFNLVGSPALS